MVPYNRGSEEHSAQPSHQMRPAEAEGNTVGEPWTPDSGRPAPTCPGASDSQAQPVPETHVTKDSSFKNLLATETNSSGLPMGLWRALAIPHRS